MAGINVCAALYRAMNRLPEGSKARDSIAAAISMLNSVKTSGFECYDPKSVS